MINIEMKTKLKETSMQTPQLELVIGNYLFCHYKYPTSFVENLRYMHVKTEKNQYNSYGISL